MRNKVIAFLILFSFECIFFVHAQSVQPAVPKEVYKRMGMGIKGGLVLSQMDRFGSYQSWSTASSYSQEVIPSGYGGCYFYYKPLRFIRVQLEVNLLGYGGLFQKELAGYTKSNTGGVSVVVNGQVVNNKYYYQDKYQMTFFEIPLVARFHAWDKRVFSPYGELGISYASLLEAQRTYNTLKINTSYYSSSSVNESWNTVNIKNDTETSAFNYVLGFGFDLFPSRMISFGLDFRMTSSFTRIFKYDLVDEFNPVTNTLETKDLVSHYHNFLMGVHLGFNLD
ncbi:MAG: PorT family protein [Cytophagales bacterium]|nr:PorT family protein [Cytophagales bacterium]